MKSKIVIALFLTLILIGIFGVKNSRGASCRGTASIFPASPIPYQNGDFTITVSGFAAPLTMGARYRFDIATPKGNTHDDAVVNNVDSISDTFYINTSGGRFVEGGYSVSIYNMRDSSDCLNGLSFCIGNTCTLPSPTGNSAFDPCQNLVTGGPLVTGSPEDDCRLCTGINKFGESNTTVMCNPTKYPSLGNSCGTWTSLGCVPNDPPNLVGWIIGLASGVAGGIAFLLILFGSFQIVTSSGVPEKIAGGKDITTSALIGLLFIFLSVLILKVIGVQILGIPGWT